MPEQLAVIAALEAAAPAAVIATTDTGWPPVFEDADLTFPSATVGASVTASLAAAEEVARHLEGDVLDGAGLNVSAGAGLAESRIVLSAHIDTKATTPGAFDNPGGGRCSSHWRRQASPTASSWSSSTARTTTRHRASRPGSPRRTSTPCAWPSTSTAQASPAARLRSRRWPPRPASRSSSVVWSRPGQDGWSAPWFESDHAIFTMRGIPSLAITCEGAHDLLATVAHTHADTLEVVDTHVLADVASFVAEWLRLVDSELLI